jgi:hypothetical protein
MFPELPKDNFLQIVIIFYFVSCESASGAGVGMESDYSLEKNLNQRIHITSLLKHVDSRSFVKIISYDAESANDNYRQSLQQSILFLNNAKDTPVVNIKFRLTYNHSADSERFLKFRLVSKLLPKPTSSLQILLMFGPTFWVFYTLKWYAKEFYFHFSRDVLITETIHKTTITSWESSVVPRYAVISTSVGLFSICLFCNRKEYSESESFSFSSHSVQRLALVDAEKMIRGKKPLARFDGWQFITSTPDVKSGLLTNMLISYRKHVRYRYIYTETFILMELHHRLNLTIFNCITTTGSCAHKTPSMYHKVLTNPYVVFCEDLIRSEEIHETKFVVMLPTPSHFRTWSIVIGPLTGEFSDLVLIPVFVMFNIFLTVLVLNSYNLRTSVSQAIGFILRPLLNEAVGRLPSSRGAFRIAFLSWLLYCMILIELYKGDLLGSLVKPYMPHAPETLTELVKSGLKYFTKAESVRVLNISQSNRYGNLSSSGEARNKEGECYEVRHSNTLVIVKKELRNLQTPTLQRLYENFKSCESFVSSHQESFRRLSHGDVLISEDVSCMAMVYTVKSLSTNRKLKISKESLKNNIYYPILTDLFTQEVRTLLRRVQEFGIWLCHIKATRRLSIASVKNIILKNSSRNILKSNDDLSEDATNLKFWHLKGMFSVTMIGLGASVVCFVIENAWVALITKMQSQK